MKTTTANGAYSLQVFESDRLIHDTGEFDNLITDLALTMGAPFESGTLCIGTGKTPPKLTDTSLEVELSSVPASFGSAATIFTRGANRYSKRSVTATFLGIEGDISEVGFRGGNKNSIRSRSLVRDGNGLVTVIPIKPEQTLKITYFVYVLIPETMATGIVTTPYGSSKFTIKPHPELTKPSGIFAGKFDNPFDGEALRAKLSGSSVNASVFSWSYDAGNQKVTATVNYVAIETNRTFIGFEASNNNKNLPIIELDTPLINPSNNDCSFTLIFSWGRA